MDSDGFASKHLFPFKYFLKYALVKNTSPKSSCGLGRYSYVWVNPSNAYLLSSKALGRKDF